MVSAQLKVTVIGMVSTELSLEDELAEAVIEGELLSKLTVTEVDVVAPLAWSTAIPVII